MVAEHRCQCHTTRNGFRRGAWMMLHRCCRQRFQEHLQGGLQLCVSPSSSGSAVAAYSLAVCRGHSGRYRHHDFDGFARHGASTVRAAGRRPTAFVDQAVVAVAGDKALRVSNASTFGSFGDMPHSEPVHAAAERERSQQRSSSRRVHDPGSGEPRAGTGCHLQPRRGPGFADEPRALRGSRRWRARPFRRRDVRRSGHRHA